MSIWITSKICWKQFPNSLGRSCTPIMRLEIYWIQRPCLLSLGYRSNHGSLRAWHAHPNWAATQRIFPWLKGVGLCTSVRTKNKPLVYGGAQNATCAVERRIRYGIIGIAKAMEIAYRDMASTKHTLKVKQHMLSRLRETIPGVDFHGDSANLEKVWHCFAFLNRWERRAVVQSWSGRHLGIGGSVLGSGALAQARTF